MTKPSHPENINDLAIRFAESNRQEQKWLRAELRDMHVLLAAIIDTYGEKGTLKVYEKDLAMNRPTDFNIEFREYKMDRCIVLRKNENI